MDHVTAMLDNPPANVRATIIDHHVVLDIIGEEVHYWSPQLNFRVEESPDDSSQSIVSGLIGPRPNVWTMFMFVYFSTGVIGFFVSSYGMSKWMLGHYTPWVWAFPIAILFMLTAYRAGKYGETLGKDQIEVLKQFVRDAAYIDK